MFSMLFSVFVLLIAAIWFIIAWKRDSRHALIMTPFLVYVIREIQANWLAAWQAPALGLSSDHYAFNLLLTGFALFIIGYLLTSIISGSSAALPLGFRDRPIKGTDRWGLAVAIAIGSAVLIAAGLFLYRGIPPIGRALSDIVLGVGEDEVARYLHQSRVDITKSHYFGGAYRGQGLLRSLMRIGWAFIIMMAYSAYLATEKKAWKTVAFALMIPGVLFVGGDGTRASLVNQIVLGFVFISLIRPVRIRSAIYAFAGIIALGVVLSFIGPKMSLSSMRASSDSEVTVLKDASLTIIHRVFRTNGVNTVDLIERVRRGDWPMRWGRVHLRDFLASIPGVNPGPPLSYELYLARNPGARGTTYQSATWAADLMVDFGPVGLLMGYALMGVLIALAQSVMFRIPKTIISTPFLAVMIVSIGSIPIGGPNGVFAALVLVAAFVMLLTIARKIGKWLPRRRSAPVELTTA